jgi:hypothetical protein
MSVQSSQVPAEEHSSIIEQFHGIVSPVYRSSNLIPAQNLQSGMSMGARLAFRAKIEMLFELERGGQTAT